MGIHTIWVNTAKQKVRTHILSANKGEISMPEALENQHRCGYTCPPPLHNATVCEWVAHRCWECSASRKCGLEWAFGVWIQWTTFKLSFNSKHIITSLFDFNRCCCCGFFKSTQQLIWIQSKELWGTPACHIHVDFQVLTEDIGKQ